MCDGSVCFSVCIYVCLLCMCICAFVRSSVRSGHKPKTPTIPALNIVNIDEAQKHQTCDSSVCLSVSMCICAFVLYVCSVCLSVQTANPKTLIISAFNIDESQKAF